MNVPANAPIYVTKQVFMFKVLFLLNVSYFMSYKEMLGAKILFFQKAFTVKKRQRYFLILLQRVTVQNVHRCPHRRVNNILQEIYF